LFGGGGPSPEEIAAQQYQEAIGSQTIMTPEQRKVQLEYLKSVGQLTPEMEQEILQKDSELKGLRADPALKAQQVAALERLSQQGREGLTLEDRTALMDIQQQEAQALRGQEEAILQNMQARGMGGAGAELAARLQASQSSADRANRSGLAQAAQAQQRALQAMSSSGTLAGQMANQEFEQQAKVGSAQDIINSFNTGSRQKVQSANVGARNRAQEYNLQDAQLLERNRVATMNEQRKSDVQANMDYVNQMNAQKVDRARAGRGVATEQRASEQRDDSGFAGTLGGLAGVAANVADTKWEMPEWLKPKAKGTASGNSNMRGINNGPEKMTIGE
jgi:hypothetical protein